MRRRKAKDIFVPPEIEEHFLLKNFGNGIFQEKAKFVEKFLLIEDIRESYREAKIGS